MRLRGGRAGRVAKLPSPKVDEGFYTLLELAWQPLAPRHDDPG